MKPELSPDFIKKYILQHHDVSELHPDYIKFLDSFTHFELKQISLVSLQVEIPKLEKAKVKQYSALKTAAPPVVVDSNGMIIDGYHRVNAAVDRGERTIQAYVGFQES